MIRFLSVSVDVTRYKDIELKLLYTMAAAEAANEAKSQFIPNIQNSSQHLLIIINDVLDLSKTRLRRGR